MFNDVTLEVLLSGIIGAIVGAYGTYIGAIRLERTRDLEKERKQRKQYLSWLKKEIDFNEQLGTSNQTTNSKIRFQIKGYEAALANSKILPSKLFEIINPLYKEIAKYNTLADYDQDKIAYGGGYLDESLLRQSTQVLLEIERIRPLIGNLR